LETDVEKRPAATLSERREFLERTAGVQVSDSTVRAGCSGAWGGEKKVGGCERERDEFLRAAWRAMVVQGIDAERLVFS
jgi:hypothetical protein